MGNIKNVCKTYLGIDEKEPVKVGVITEKKKNPITKTDLLKIKKKESYCPKRKNKLKKRIKKLQ